MKQAVNYVLILLVMIGVFSSCDKKIQELQVNPNNPASVPPKLLLGTILTDISGTGSQGSLGGINSWDNVHAWNQYHCQNYDYYGNNMYSWSSGSFDPYLVLKNVVQMEKEATPLYSSSVNPYKAIGRFIRAYYLYNLTSLFGDVPLEQALLGEGNFTPSYTSQQKVFLYVLNQLDTANTEFATLISNSDYSLSAAQDIYYGSINPAGPSSSQELGLWQKLANTFKLRVLIGLSNKASDATLNVPAQFANIINNPSKYPVFSSANDDLRFFYNPGGSNTYSTYPFNNSNYGSIAGRYNMSYTYVNALTSLNDPRVFVTCEPVSNTWNREFVLNGYAIDSSYTDSKGNVINCYKKTDSNTIQPNVLNDIANPAQYKLFVGASTGEPLSTMYPNASAGKYSFINRYRYYLNFTGEPDVLVGYKEMCFNIAEAIERGWVSGNAETWYKTGITASMAFYGIDVTQNSFSAYFMPAGATAPSQAQSYPYNFDFTSYYNQTSVKLSATPATAINQIVLQKYLACFENSGYEGYYNWRRTGVPAFQSGTGVGNGGVIPKRWAYPVAEQTQNTTNWKAALSNQQFSSDDLNQTMWLLK